MAHRILRACPATAIPAGDVTTLAAGEMVEVAQTLGGNVTVRTSGGLYRVDRANVPAIEGLVLADDGGAPAGEFSEQAVWDAMRTCFDPEIPVNIVDLGLVYDLSIEKTPSGANAVDVKMTLTAPGCGMGPVIAEDARQKIAALPTVERAKVHIVWDPVWNPRMISEAGRKSLGLE
jgi:probable FeS assembly SUF system protein SufT